MVMGKLIGEAEAESKPAAVVQPRRQVFGHVRGIVIFLFVVVVLAFVFGYRAELKKLFYSKPAQQTGIETGKAIK